MTVAERSTASRYNPVVAWPEFFIVGAPKCGTTALAGYLRDHPGAFLPEVKEPHFFADDFRRASDVDDQAAYLELFAEAAGHQVRGEASVFYLASRVAVPAILSRRPDARLIVMLRSPLDLFPALHGQYLFTFFEDEVDPRRAWHLQSGRVAGTVPLPAACDAPALLRYADLCALGRQLEQLYARVPRSQVHLIFFDDFASDTARSFRDCLEFLGLAADQRRHFPVANPAAHHRSRRLARALYHPPGWILRLARRARRRWPSAYDRMRHRARAINQEQAPRQPLSATFRAELADHFRADIELLARLTGRSLDHWLQ